MKCSLIQYEDVTAIDLFAGIGGIRISFEIASINFIYASEIDRYARMVYEETFCKSDYETGYEPAMKYSDVVGDITKIDEKDIPSFDILTAGFPCQPFSSAGKRKGFDDVRGTLFYDIIRIVKYHMPRAIFLENVKALLWHNKGETFKIMKGLLEDLGYEVHYQVLNAKHFGTPQNRERLYIVAFREKSNFKFPLPTHEKTRVGDILQDNVDDKYTLSDKMWAGHQRRMQRNKELGKGFGYRLFNKNSAYTSTLTARYGKDGSEILIEQDGKNPRKLTPTECLALQGLSISGISCVSDYQAYRLIGNTVAYHVVSKIAMNIRYALDEQAKMV